MIIKFTARNMPMYKGTDGYGKTIELNSGDTADVADAIGKMLCAKYHHNFQEVKSTSTVEVESKSDKKGRKLQSYRSKT